MTKKQKTIVSAVAAIVLVAAVALTLILLLGGRTGGTLHLESRGLDFTLTRESLTTHDLDESGKLASLTNDKKTDFTASTKENVFGVTGNTVIVPGSRFSADLVIANKSENAQPFSYWLEIRLSGEINELARQLKVTVTPEGLAPQTFSLSEGLVLGGERNPLAIVRGKQSSSFTVKVEFPEDQLINDGAQKETVLFDLIVYAAAYAE